MRCWRSWRSKKMGTDSPGADCTGVPSTSKRIAHLVEHHQRAHRDAERLEAQLRLLQRKLAAARRIAPSWRSSVTGTRTLVHWSLSVISTPTSIALARRADVGGAQPDRRVVRAVEQRLRQQVLARSVARALRHAGRKIRPAASRIAGSSTVSSFTGKLMSKRVAADRRSRTPSPRAGARRSRGCGRGAPSRRRDTPGSAAATPRRPTSILARAGGNAAARRGAGAAVARFRRRGACLTRGEPQ